MLCRVLVKILGEKDDSLTLLRPRNVHELSDSTRKSWVEGMKRFVESETEYQHIRPLDFLFFLDGFVEVQPSSDQTTPLPCPTTYPPPYRIPPETITDLEPNEKVRRSELFALGSLIYEIYANEAPFESLKDSDVQARYRSAQFPNVTHLPQWPIILSCWSVEFARELYAILSKWLLALLYLSLPQKLRYNSNYLIPPTDYRVAEGKFKRFSRALGTYTRAHPFLFGFQCASATVGVAAAVAIPVLGAAGFGALGPAAGSSAVAWQASM
ncbi:hypothetical protein MMC28_007553 [Mycoblastus sanguinarius]|nr:hypothetical protein [Mycoblastus sanguinarius]